MTSKKEWKVAAKAAHWLLSAIVEAIASAGVNVDGAGYVAAVRHLARQRDEGREEAAAWRRLYFDALAGLGREARRADRYRAIAIHWRDRAAARRGGRGAGRSRPVTAPPPRRAPPARPLVRRERAIRRRRSSTRSPRGAPGGGPCRRGAWGVPPGTPRARAP